MTLNSCGKSVFVQESKIIPDIYQKEKKVNRLILL